MTLPLLSWVVSLLGAAAFFAAGWRWPRRAKPAAGNLSHRLEVAERERASLGDECDRLAALAGKATDDVAALEGEVARLRTRGHALRAVLGRRRVELAEARAALTSAQRRPHEGEAETRQLLARALTAESEAERLRASLAVQRKARKEAPASEMTRWRDQLGALEARLAAAPSPEIEKTLRHDLTLAREMLRAHDERAERLATDNVILRQEVQDLSAQLLELGRLRAENAELRARDLVGDGADQGAPEVTAVDLPTLGPARGLQTLVDRVGGGCAVRGAVIADELGLVVASHGEHGEELAALGSLFVRAGAQARHILPLRALSRMTVEDAESVSVTVQPLHDAQAGAPGAQLALILLTVGTQPEAGPVATDHPSPP